MNKIMLILEALRGYGVEEVGGLKGIRIAVKFFNNQGITMIQARKNGNFFTFGKIENSNRGGYVCSMYYTGGSFPDDIWNTMDYKGATDEIKKKWKDNFYKNERDREKILRFFKGEEIV